MAWFIPILIFLARICDVSMGTVRMLFVIGGARKLAALLGFFEVMIWVLAVGGVIKYLTNPFALLAYAAGFATGTLVGMAIEDRLALGYRVVRVISSDKNVDVCTVLRDHDFRVTRIDGQGRSGPVEIAFAVIRRRSLPQLLSVLEQYAPEAFVSVERADRASGGGLSAPSVIGSRPSRISGAVRK